MGRGQLCRAAICRLERVKDVAVGEGLMFEIKVSFLYSMELWPARLYVYMGAGYLSISELVSSSVQPLQYERRYRKLSLYRREQ